VTAYSVFILESTTGIGFALLTSTATTGLATVTVGVPPILTVPVTGKGVFVTVTGAEPGPATAASDTNEIAVAQNIRFMVSPYPSNQGWAHHERRVVRPVGSG